MLLFVMKLLVLRKNFLKQKKKDGELTSFCVQKHTFGDWYGVIALGIFLHGDFCALHSPLATDQVQRNSHFVVLVPVHFGWQWWDSSSTHLSDKALSPQLMSNLIITPQL